MYRGMVLVNNLIQEKEHMNLDNQVNIQHDLPFEDTIVIESNNNDSVSRHNIRCILEMISIHDLEFSVRAKNILNSRQIKNLYQTLDMTEDYIARTRNCGIKTAKEIFIISRIYAKCILESCFLGTTFKIDHDIECIGESYDFSWVEQAQKRINEIFEQNPKDKILIASIDEIIKSIPDEPVNKNLLNEFPLYKSNSTIPKDIVLHHSYNERIPIAKLDLSVRAVNVLISNHIEKLRDLLFTSYLELLRKRNCGKNTINEIQTQLSKYLLKVDVTIDLFTFLDELQIGKKNYSVFLEFLYSETNQFLTYQELGLRYSISKQRVSQILQKIIAAIKIKYHEGSLKQLLYPLNKVLTQFKGAIAVDTFINEESQKLYKDDIRVRRYIHFYEIVTELIEFNKVLGLFWDKNSKCVQCDHIKGAIRKSDKSNLLLLVEINALCKMINCEHDQNQVFDVGQILLQMPIPKISTDKKLQSLINQINKNEIRTFSEVYGSELPELTKDHIRFLDFIVKNGWEINNTRLVAFCEINKFNLNTMLTEINLVFYEKHNQQIVQYNSKNELWEINDYLVGLTYSDAINEDNPQNNITMNDQPEMPMDHNSIAESVTSENNFMKEDFLIRISNTLNNVNKSYKFYWAEALQHFISQKAMDVEFRQMAASMCAFAWEDVLIRKNIFATDDYMPELVKKHYISSPLSTAADYECIYDYFYSSLQNHEIERLLKYVPTHFLQSFTLNIPPSGSISIDLYSIGNKVIKINDFEVDVAFMDDITKCISELKGRYFDSIKQAEGN
jgi:DNA-directed RNA polymerase alpha subunit